MLLEDRIKSIESNKFSKYKTKHKFENYGTIKSIDDYVFFTQWAKKNNRDIFILGNGSNTLFTKKKITSLVLENKLPNEIKCISEVESLYEVSSVVQMHEILKFCYKKSLDSFYYLSSVPATVGGALAMNAGEGKKTNRSIYDFVESVTYIDSDGSTIKVDRADMHIKHRETIFTGCQNKLIVNAIFKFPPKDMMGLNPIVERITWSKNNQDNVSPNCGSVFKDANFRIMGWLRGVKIGETQYSKKTKNWINNKSESHLPILFLILITKILHFVFVKKCKLEVIRVK